MKKFVFSLFSLFLAFGIAQAQVDDPAAALKSAKKLLNSYSSNPTDNTDKLDQAKEKVDFALADATIADTYAAWMMKGKIYSELAGRDVTNFGLAQVEGRADKFALKSPMAGIGAFDAFKMAMEKANPKKKFEKKDALKKMQEVVNHLATVGNFQLDKKNFNNAYSSLNTILKIKDVLNANGINTIMENAEEFQNHRFVTGYCAMVSDMKPEATQLFEGLLKDGYDNEGSLYSYLFTLKKDEDEIAALKYLNEGSAKYPGNKDILFAKINYLIQKEDYKQLQEELEKAIAADPDNPSVHSALGNVYMNLFQQEFAAGNTSVADQHFEKSLGYYESALKLDDSLFDVQYSIGSLYYNKAVEITKVMNELPMSENKKYNALNEEAKKLFTAGLPFFKKAESMNPNDLNTLIALKEIFARMDDFTTSNEFKARLDTVRGGGKNEKSYF